MEEWQEVKDLIQLAIWRIKQPATLLMDSNSPYEITKLMITQYFRRSKKMHDDFCQHCLGVTVNKLNKVEADTLEQLVSSKVNFLDLIKYSAEDIIRFTSKECLEVFSNGKL